MLLWIATFNGTLVTRNYFTPYHWHVLEMLLGYNLAVIAGFDFMRRTSLARVKFRSRLLTALNLLP